MTRRECGTCRFFERSGIGESGYCRNARCRDIVGPALVRRQELACRIGWDHDFYEAAGVDAIPGFDRPSADAMRQRTGYQGTVPDDLIVGIEQARPMTDTPLPQTARVRTSSVGEAHRRALERRQLAQQAGDSVPPRRLIGVAQAADQGAGAQKAPETRTRQETLLGDEGVSLPRSPERSRPDPIAPASPHEAPTTHLPIPTSRAPLGQNANEQTPTRVAPPGLQAPPALSNDYGQPAGPPMPLDSQGARSAAPPPVMPPPNEAPRNAIEADWYAMERHRHRGKRCANCRDFQMAESGDRGWCRNRFAFPTPQLVGPNDLACLSCIGTWWAANDQWWLARAPLPPEDIQTPMADEILEEIRERDRRQAALRRPGAG